MRAGARVLALGLWTTFIALDLMAGAAAAKVAGEPGRRWYRSVPGRWSRVCLRICGVSVEVQGTPPRRPFFLVSNHLSYIDIWVLHANVTGRFLAKREIASWPGIGLLARGAGTLFIDREATRGVKNASGDLGRALAGGDGVIVFPEGTSSAGYEVLPFKASLFQVALDAGLDVHTANLTYATEPGCPPAATSMAWWGDMGFGGHALRFLAIPRSRAWVRFHPETIQAQDRKQLAMAARDSVLSGWKPHPSA